MQKVEKREWFWVLILGWLVFTSFSAFSWGQCEPGWKSGQGIPGVSGTINAIVKWDSDGAGPEPELLVVGGEISAAGNVVVDNLAAWDGTSWRNLGDFTPIDINHDLVVNALAVFNGDLIVGGQFGQAGGVTAYSIARFDGTNWHAMTGGASGNWYEVYALLMYQGDFIVGGMYQDNISALPYWSITRWDGSAWFSIGTNIGARALCEFNGDLIAGGGNKVYRWDGVTWTGMSNGSIDDEWSLGIQALEVYDGSLYVGGHIAVPAFMAMGEGLARWNGTTWEPVSEYQLFPGNDVYDMEVYDGKLFVSGTFSYVESMEGPYYRWLVSWDGTTWQSYHDVIIGPYVGGMAAIDGDLYVNASTQMADGSYSWGFSRWDGSHWHSFDPGNTNGLGRYVIDFTVHDGDLIAVGNLDRAGTSKVNDIARWDGSSWHSVGGGIPEVLDVVSGIGNNQVNSVTSYQGDIIVSGRFQFASEGPYYQVIRWDGQTWQPMNNGLSYYIADELLVYQDELIVTNYDGVFRWNGASWIAMGSGITNISEAKVYDNILYVVARYPYPGDNGCVFYWNGANWQLATQPIDKDVYAFAVYNGEIVISGDLSNIGPGFNNIARWDGSNWQPLGDGLSSTADILTVYKGDLIALGGFATAGGISSNQAARWDGVNWQPMGAGIDTNQYLWKHGASTVYNGELIVGGGIETAGGEPSYGWARWGVETPLVGDLNHDCAVDLLDLTQFCSYWLAGSCETGGWCDEADMNYDQRVNLQDFVKLMQNW